jgi:hypothetical protein
MRYSPYLLTTALVLRARWVMLWVVLAFGVAIASPLVKPQSMGLLCTGSGVMKLLVTAEDGSQPTQAHGLDCALCMLTSAPPPEQQPLLSAAHGLAYALQTIPAARIAWLTAPPLPARGPPLL